MSIRALKTFSKHYQEILEWDVSFADWLAQNNTSMTSVVVTPDAGIQVTHTEANGVSSLVVSGGAAGSSYNIVLLCNAANGLKRRAMVFVRVTGAEASDIVAPAPGVDPYNATLITGAAVAQGAGIARSGNNWVYQCLLLSDAPGATATFRIRVGTGADCVIEFATPGEIGTVTTGSTLNAQGKYQGVGVTYGNAYYPYHAADIVTITGTNPLATVTGAGN
jgi:hypothetical protein